jgi:hypothetical protein
MLRSARVGSILLREKHWQSPRRIDGYAGEEGQDEHLLFSISYQLFSISYQTDVTPKKLTMFPIRDPHTWFDRVSIAC